MWLAAAGGGVGLVPIYYVVTILGVLGGGALALFKWQKNQRQQWQNEGMHAQKQAEALNANTEAAKQNTAAIGALDRRMAEYMTHTDDRLNGHQRRIERLEDRLPRHQAPGG